MSFFSDCIYWVGGINPSLSLFKSVNHIQSVNAIPDGTTGAVCFDYDDEQELQTALKLFFSKPYRWSWCVFTTQKTAFSECVADDVFNEESAFRLWQEVKTKFMTISEPDLLSPLVGWLGINRKRSVLPLKDIQTTSLYFHPIIACFYPDLQSAYNYVLAEKRRGILETDELVDRIRVCTRCHSGHLNYVEVCPSCNSIDIDTQNSLHCFTCGNVGEQQQFLRKGKLECPKCLIQLRHIGVDYDRPLENYKCNNCAHHFVEAKTVCQCLICSTITTPEQLVVRKVYKFTLGEQGEYVYQNGKTAQAPELSIKGKVDVSFFKNLISWVNKVALRHNDPYLLLGLHLPSFKYYSQKYGESKLFSLVEQITLRLSGMFRNTDICCQYRQDILLVLMPKTPKSSLPVLQQKLEQLSDLITDDDFELSVFSWELPELAINNSVDVWIENIIGDIYAS